MPHADDARIQEMIEGTLDTPAGTVPRVRTRLSLRDRLGGLAVRCSFRRMDYAVPPGLYAVGAPGPESPVLVSANYKLSFDHLRRSLVGRDAWLLVLEEWVSGPEGPEKAARPLNALPTHCARKHTPCLCSAGPLRRGRQRANCHVALVGGVPLRPRPVARAVSVGIEDATRSTRHPASLDCSTSHAELARSAATHGH